MKKITNEQKRWESCLLGLAIGDCLGVPLEFSGRLNPFKPAVTEIIGGGLFKLPAGAWTDDTSMALCMASSIVDNQGFDYLDHMKRYLAWRNMGYLSSIGNCFDIGNTVGAALTEFERTGKTKPFCGPEHERYSGNGSLMRLAPAPMAAKTLEDAIAVSRESSRTTHGSALAIDACGYYGALIWQALHGATKKQLFDYQPKVASRDVQIIINGSYRQPLAHNWVRGGGFVVDALEAALWAFHQSTDFESGALLAVNLGEDSDTTGAIYGQLAGAFYGVLPTRWISPIFQRDLIVHLAAELYEYSTK